MSNKHFVPGHQIHTAKEVNPNEAKALEPHMGHLYLVLIAAIISFAITQIVKPFLWKACKEMADSFIRLFAVLTGAFVAYTLSDPLQMVDIWMGACAGALNAYIVKAFKQKIKSTLTLEDTPKPEEPKKED